MAEVPLTLTDGTYIPAGTQLCTASYHISQDSSFATDANTFNGFRYYEKRQVSEEAERNLFVSTDKDHHHFGHGRYACPGRFFASDVLKMILGQMILDYDFKYPDGHGHPRNLTTDEFIYPDLTARLLMRRRRSNESNIMSSSSL